MKGDYSYLTTYMEVKTKYGWIMCEDVFQSMYPPYGRTKNPFDKSSPEINALIFGNDIAKCVFPHIDSPLVSICAAPSNCSSELSEHIEGEDVCGYITMTQFINSDWDANLFKTGYIRAEQMYKLRKGVKPSRILNEHPPFPHVLSLMNEPPFANYDEDWNTILYKYDENIGTVRDYYNEFYTKILNSRMVIGDFYDGIPVSDARLIFTLEYI